MVYRDKEHVNDRHPAMHFGIWGIAENNCNAGAAEEPQYRRYRKFIQEEKAKHETKRALRESLGATIAATAKKRGSRRRVSCPALSSDRETNVFRNRSDSVRLPQAQPDESVVAPCDSQESRDISITSVVEGINSSTSALRTTIEDSTVAGERRVREWRQKERLSRAAERRRADQLLEELHKRRQACIASSEARRRRDAKEVHRKALEGRRVRERQIEDLKEISRRGARLSASGRCLARQRVKGAALMTKLAAAMESVEKRDEQVLSKPLSSDARRKTNCGHSRRVVAESPSTASILDLLEYDAGQEGEAGVGIQTVQRWDPLDQGVSEVAKRRRTRRKKRRLRQTLQQKRRSSSPGQ